MLFMMKVVIVFGDGISQSDLSFIRSDDHLKIYINDDPSQGIQIKNHYKNKTNEIESIEFSNGDISSISQLIQAMSSFSSSNAALMEISNITVNTTEEYSISYGSELNKQAI